MIIDVIFEGDEHSRREARNSNPPGRTITLPGRFTTSQMVDRIIERADGMPASISLLRFHGIPFQRIFPLSSDSPLVGGGTSRTTTPEEDKLLKLNSYFVPGRANVFFIDCNVSVDSCFLRNPWLRQKLWSSVARFVSSGESGLTEVSSSHVGAYAY